MDKKQKKVIFSSKKIDSDEKIDSEDTTPLVLPLLSASQIIEAEQETQMRSDGPQIQMQSDGPQTQQSERVQSERMQSERMQSDRPQKEDTRSNGPQEGMQKDLLNFIDVYNTINSTDPSIQILKFLKTMENVSTIDDEYNKLYSSIVNDIIKVPSINDVLKLSISYEEKYSLIEQIILLNNYTPISYEFFDLRKIINDRIEKYKHITTSAAEYEKYKVIEASLHTLITKSIEHQILDLNIKDYNKAYIYNRYKLLMSSEHSNSHANNKLRKWVDCVINLPITKEMKILYDDSSYAKNEYLFNIKSLLDKEIYGLDTVKEKILFLLNNRITCKNNSGLNLALSGPPGTAKTSIINFLAKAVNLPFFQINTAGIKNSDFLLGHNFTYEGSGPGCIVQALHSMGCNNGIIYFDEFDKISTTDHGLEISRALLHITDSSQNDKFHDHYIGEQFDIDLSSIWFTYSMNNKELIDPTLRDRISIIEIDGYTYKEKLVIISDYLLPKALINLELQPKSVTFDIDALNYIIELSSDTTQKKSGVRQIKHILEEILMKINLLKTITDDHTSNIKPVKLANVLNQRKKNKLSISFEIEGFKLPIILTRKNIKELKLLQKRDNYLSMYA